MAIEPEEYETMRAWSALLIDQAVPLPPNLPPEAHPIACLDEMARTSPSRARQGLAMMVGDLIEESDALSQPEVRRLDQAFQNAGLPTLSDVRLRFQRRIKRILKTGAIRSEVDYYAVRNAVEGISDERERARLWELLAEFEGRAISGS